MSKVRSKRLGDLITLKRGYDLPENNRIPGSYPVISSAGISGYHNEYKVDGQGVVTGRYGTLGQMYFVDGKYWPHNTALYVRDFKGNDPKYVYYLLSCLGRIRTSDKSAVPGVNRNELHEMFVPAIEDKATQIAIRKNLESIDDKIELNNRINAELEAMAKTLYDYWFVQFDFPFDFAQGKPAANGKPYKSSGGRMVYNPILKREIPEEWNVVKLGDVVTRSGTGLNPRDNFKLGEGNNYYITIKDIEQGKINFSDKSDRISDDSLRIIDKRSDLQQGDILFTSIQPVGITYLIREKPKHWNINESVFTLRADYSLVTSEYLFMLLSSDEIKIFTANSSTGSVHKGIRHSVLKSFAFPYASLHLIREFTCLISPILEKQHVLQSESENFTKLRDWLLPMLMNGQVTVK
jgi:type I restriction enzyme S subunit